MIRKLDVEEHIKTRKLWEKVFKEDTPEFLDYYYSVKVKTNEIYVIEDGDDIVSMIHLNPYQMRIEGEIYQTHYIVAVATDEAYRKRGYMRRLLCHVLDITEKRGEPFTFLMPASEAIYKPFGFEFVYMQGRTKIAGKQMDNSQICIVEAAESDCGAMAEYANDQLMNYDVTTWRDASYYKMILAEQKSENGGILLAKEGNKIRGVFCYAKESGFEIREPLFDNEVLLKGAIYSLTGNEEEEVLCTAYGSAETKPIIMAKVLQKKMSNSLKNKKVFINEVV